MTQETLIVEGMTCQHCVKTITDALNGQSGVYKLEIHFDKKEVKIEYDEEKTTLKQNKTTPRKLYENYRLISSMLTFKNNCW